MAKAKKKTLPKDFDDLLARADIEEIRAVFETYDLNARGGRFKQTALAFNDLPDAVAHWLVAEGADIEAADMYGETPLISRAGHWQGHLPILLEVGADVASRDSRGETPLHKAAKVGHVENVRLLIESGADASAVDNAGLTPLGQALEDCSNANIAEFAQVAEVLLAQTEAPTGERLGLFQRLLKREPRPGSAVTEQMRQNVREIGVNFEFHRENFNPDYLEETVKGLEKLNRLFGVEPAPRRLQHDGIAPIRASSTNWQDQHEELWSLLVPSAGAASTVQGEVIRLSGRLAREIDGNGAINWDEDFKRMAEALLIQLGSGMALPEAELKEAGAIIAEVKRKRGDTRRLSELAVQWVGLNPDPITLPKPAYAR